MTVHGGKGTFPMADVNNDSAEDLAYTIAKTISFPQNNWYLEPTGESGQLVLCVNPMWAERFGKEWPNVEDFQQYLWEWAWQPIDLFRPGNAEVLETKGRVDDEGRVRLLRAARAARAGGLRWARQPARGGAHQLLRERDAERRRDAGLTAQLHGGRPLCRMICTKPPIDLRAIVEAGSCTGAAAILTDASRTIALETVGATRADDGLPITERTRFRWASCSKPVTAVATLLAVQDGLLDLDAPIGLLPPRLLGALPLRRRCRRADHRAPPAEPHGGAHTPGSRRQQLRRLAGARREHR